jgi:hypothetical protein
VVEEDCGACAEPMGVPAEPDGGPRRRAMVRPSDTVADSGTSSSQWSGKLSCRSGRCAEPVGISQR